MKFKVVYWFAAIGYSFIILLISHQTKPLPMLKPLFSYDKLIHLVEYGFFTFFWWMAAATTWSSMDRRFPLWIFLFSFFFALSDEFHQSFIPGRDASWLDVTADFIGMVLVIGWMRYRQRIRCIEEANCEDS